MRLTAAEKYEIIQTVERSELGVNRTLQEFGIHKSTFYKWYNAYLEKDKEGLEPLKNKRDRKSTRLNSSHVSESRMPSSA